jgi:hypothetical protein
VSTVLEVIGGIVVVMVVLATLGSIVGIDRMPPIGTDLAALGVILVAVVIGALRTG